VNAIPFLVVFLVVLALLGILLIYQHRRYPPFVRGVAKEIAGRYPFKPWDILAAYDRLGDWAEVTRLCQFCQATGRARLYTSIAIFKVTKSPGH
jgi:hypothetical protein